MNNHTSRLDDLYLESYELDTSELTPTYRSDLRTRPPDIFIDDSNHDWSKLSWKDVGKPFSIENFSQGKRDWERKWGQKMSVPIQWQHFNRKVHELFTTDLFQKRAEVRKKYLINLLTLKVKQADQTLREAIRFNIWTHLHQKEDAFWDPRGKRAVFEGLDVDRPNILLLGAGDGYDAMQLLAMYPRGHAVLVDFDKYADTDRFGKFPERYPFLGKDPKTGYWNVFTKDEFDIDFEVCDIQKLKFGREFDIVISAGLIEHYPDKYKPLAFHFHRQFLKPGGYAIMTSTRNQFQLRMFYKLLGGVINYSYRELMTAPQLALYAYKNSFQILRCGSIKAYNFVVARER